MMTMSNNKQTMKLYTEEQLKKAIAIGFDWCHQKHIPSDDMIDTFIENLIPIELPSDEEIEEALSYRIIEQNSFRRGAKWMRDKIQGGNK